ncbi:MAG: hypothetical protein KDC44_14775 [Phaeodactylibacter sp.]|nr:hypothetical protein [Phaeodactylibacter sp.]
MKRKRPLFRFFASLTWIAFFRLVLVGVSLTGILALIGFSAALIVVEALSQSEIIQP